jgi:D-alanine--poly(phosphoribitol) ligase subunit 1
VIASSYVNAVDAHANEFGERVAFANSDGARLTYAELRQRSDALACWIAANPDIPARQPIVIYGHKSPLMLVAFFACVKAGHAYVPVDTVYPAERVANIASQVAPTAVFDTIGTFAAAGAAELGAPVFGAAELTAAAAGNGEGAAELAGLAADDAFYILFTSGSTGTPKGVEVMAECVDNMAAWMAADYGFDEPEGEGQEAGFAGRVWFNRAPFSFDLSTTDLFPGLLRGDTLFANEAAADASLAATFQALSASGATDWVSTPSFLDQCLADASFGRALMPRLRRMIFIGETLRPETVRGAKERFGEIEVYNGYGPTESTDLVTLTRVTNEMLASGKALPVGYVKPGTELFVVDPDTLEPVADGTPGELYIVGNTVARGYWKRPELTEACFHSCPEALAQGRRSYRTGDEVTRDADGMLHFHGRLDLQVKLHGFRIELGDIESSLAALPEVRMACVLPVRKDGACSRLMAVVVPADLAAPRGFGLTKQLKDQLKRVIPTYMVPSSIKYIDAMPLNPNGKADRKALAAMFGV